MNSAGQRGPCLCRARGAGGARDSQRLRTTAEGYKTAVVAAPRVTPSASRCWSTPTGGAEVTRKRLWLGTVEQVLAGRRKVGGDGRQLIYVPMTQPSGESGTRRADSHPPVLPQEVIVPQSGATPDAAGPRPTRGARAEGGSR